MKLLKIQKIRKSRGSLIGAQNAKLEGAADLEQEELERRLENSMSIYAKKKAFLQNRQYRPVTSVYNKVSSQSLKKEELQEIRKVKNGLTKQGVKVSM